MFNMFMQEAIAEANAAGKGEIPVGAVLVKNGEIIARGSEFREHGNTALGHAEIAAIHAACIKESSWRLNECDIYVTLEPCPMCAGAILSARIRRVYFGSYNEKTGAFGSVADLSKLFRYGKTEIYGGIMEKECDELINNRFADIRKKSGG